MFFGINKNKNTKPDEVLESEKIYQEGLATIKDLIAPSAMKVNANYIQIGSSFAKTIFVIAYPKYLRTSWFSPIINIDFPMDISIFMHPVDTREIMKTLRKSATQVESQINIEQEEGKIRDPMKETAIQNIEELRDQLMQGTEKLLLQVQELLFFQALNQAGLC